MIALKKMSQKARIMCISANSLRGSLIRLQGASVRKEFRLSRIKNETACILYSSSEESSMTRPYLCGLDATLDSGSPAARCQICPESSKVANYTINRGQKPKSKPSSLESQAK